MPFPNPKHSSIISPKNQKSKIKNQKSKIPTYLPTNLLFDPKTHPHPQKKTSHSSIPSFPGCPHTLTYPSKKKRKKKRKSIYSRILHSSWGKKGEGKDSSLSCNNRQEHSIYLVYIKIKKSTKQKSLSLSSTIPSFSFF